MQLDGEPWAQTIPVNAAQPLLARAAQQPLACLRSVSQQRSTAGAGGAPLRDPGSGRFRRWWSAAYGRQRRASSSVLDLSDSQRK